MVLDCRISCWTYTVDGESVYMLFRCRQNYIVKSQDTRSLSFHRVLETWGITVRKRERIVGSEVQDFKL